MVGGIGPEGVVPEGRLHGRVEGLDPGAVLLGAGLVEREGGEEAAGVRVGLRSDPYEGRDAEAMGGGGEGRAGD